MRDFLNDDDVPMDSLSRIFVETRHNKAVFQLLDELRSEPRTAHHAWGRSLIGQARTGKTTLLASYLRSCERGEKGRTPCKYLYVELTSDTKPSSIAYETLKVMGDPNPGFGKPAERTDRVLATVARRNYELIIFDEAHFLVDSESKKVQHDGVSWFNSLLNGGRTPIVLLGYDQLGDVVASNQSLAGRLLTLPKLKPYDINDRDDLLEFIFVLRELEDRLGLPTPSQLDELDTAARICVTCRGCLGLLQTFLTEARALARRLEHSCLTRETLLRTAGDVTGRWNVGFNPFTVEDVFQAVGKPVPKKG